MTKILAAAAVAGFAGSAVASFTAVGAIDAGNPSGGFASGLNASGGFYQDALGADSADAINPLFFGAFPTIEFDTFVAMDGTGVNFGGDTTAMSFTGSGPFADANSLAGDSWFPTGAALPTGDTDADGFNDMFIARLTFTGDLSGDLGIANVNGINGNNVLLSIDGTAGSTSLDGTSLFLELRAVDNGGIVNGTTFDVYVEEVPAPGAAVLAGVAGLAAVRRRR